MPRPKPDPELVALVLEAVRAGGSCREVAVEAGISQMTVQRWAKAAGVKAAEPTPEHMRPAEPEPEAPDLVQGEGNAATLAFTRAMQANLLRMSRTAEKSGNFASAQKAARDAAGLAAVIARLELGASADSDVLRISRNELRTAEATIEARLQALADRGPIRCADCARALSVLWGTGPAEK